MAGGECWCWQCDDEVTYEDVRRLCLVFTLVYSLSALCKISPALPLLLLGRVLGGVATSILCTTFEAW